MSEINSLLKPFFLLLAFIIALLNELILRSALFVVMLFIPNDPFFMIDHGHYFLLDHSDVYIYLSIQFVLFFFLLSIFNKIKNLKIKYNLILIGASIITPVSYYFSSPKQLSWLASITNHTFSNFSFEVLLLHIFTFTFLTYVFFKITLDKKVK